MAKNYEIKGDTITFSKKPHVIDHEKKIALVAFPFPGIRELEITKETKIEVTCKKVK